jgi:molybdopterin synthase catalytic subunit
MRNGATLVPVRVTVRLFAGLRERAGWSRKEIDAGRVGDVWAALDLGDEPEGLLYAVNKEYAPVDQELREGDEVALIPPVSGGAFVLTDEPVSLDAVVNEVASEEAGAIATFSGTARRRSRGRIVHYLDYEGYEGMAEEMMAKHRADALAACKDAIDILKVEVPLWKKEVYEGGEEWIGRGS